VSVGRGHDHARVVVATICIAAHSKLATHGRLYMEEHRTSTGHHNRSPKHEERNNGRQHDRALHPAAAALLVALR
jgi:hypothetical protein